MKIINVNAGEFVSIVDASIVVGSSLIYSRNFERAYSMVEFRPELESLQEEPCNRLRRFVDGEGYGFRFPNPIYKVGSFCVDVIPLNLLHPYNYFHFLIESLPSLLSLVQGGLVSKDSLLVSGYMHENMQSALNIALNDFRVPLLQLELAQYIECDRVVTTPDSFHASELLSGVLSDFTYSEVNLKRLQNTFRKYWSPQSSQPSQKIYIHRPSPTRQLVNSSGLAMLAQSYGYRVVDPGTLSFSEQVDLFSSSSRIIGPTGAWAANLAFVPNGARVTVLMPSTCCYAPSIWTHLGNVFGVEVLDISCRVHKLHPYHPIHSDFYISDEEFSALL